MSYDVNAVRAQFPALAEGAAHFDGPGGSQVPGAVGDAVAATLVSAVSNRGQMTASERRADTIVVAARAAMADLLNVDPRGVVFGRSMTALTYDLARTLAKRWQPGDEVVVTRLDHDANIRPWYQAAERVGATVRMADFDPVSGALLVSDIEAVLSDRTVVVALTAASNLIGTRPPVAEVADIAHAAGALVYVDGVHYTPHSSVDVGAMGADFYACSPYKFCGPHCGVLAASPGLLETLQPDRLLPATDAVPERFELGTLPYELLAGTTAAVDFLASLVPAPGSDSRRHRLVGSVSALETHEDVLRAKLEEGLRSLGTITMHGCAGIRTPTVLITLEKHRPAEVHAQLASLGVNAPAGSFYALEASRHLGLGDSGGVRIGLAPYTNDDDIARLLNGLERLT